MRICLILSLLLTMIALPLGDTLAQEEGEEPNIIVIDGDCTLADAIIAANLDAVFGECPAGNGNDVLELTQDIVLTQSVDDTQGNNALPLISSNIVIEGNGFTITADNSDIEEDLQFRIFVVVRNDQRGLAGDLTLRNMAIEGGRTGISSEGGALLNRSGNVTLEGVTFRDNEGGNFENAAAIFNTEGGLVIADQVIFEDNLSFAVVNCTGASARFTATLFSQNAGNIYNCAESTVEITESGFIDNLLPPNESNGGAIYNLGNIDVAETVFYRNAAPFYNEGTVANFIASGNLIDDSVGITFTNINGNGRLTNNTITSSTDSAIYHENGQLFVINNTIVFNNINEDPEGGGVVLNGSGLTLWNSIVAFNFGEDCRNLGNEFFEGGSNASFDGSCLGLSPFEDVSRTLADNGGPTNTLALPEGSSAIDAGNPENCPSTDQRGAPRDGQCDVGAYEFGAEVPVETPEPEETTE